MINKEMKILFFFSEKGQIYKQKKPTMYPPWSTTFDAHVHRGRIMHVMVKDRTAELKSEATVPLDSLATRCKKENGKLEIWVSEAGDPTKRNGKIQGFRAGSKDLNI